jgi:(2Fe-2S) ferredoxin
MPKPSKKLIARARARGLGGVHGDEASGYHHHLLICTGDGCCRGDEGARTLRRARRTAARLTREGCPILVSEVACFKLCRRGPLAVAYPDGTWYHAVTPDVVDRICEAHLRDGTPLDDHRFAHNPLPPTAR